MLRLSSKVSAFLFCLQASNAFVAPASKSAIAAYSSTSLSATTSEKPVFCRRNMLQLVAISSLAPTTTAWADFAPGGTLVDREVGVTVGNSEASKTRSNNNSNVLFDKDYYFKFGAAPSWIEPDSTDFPKTMPFTLSQQRYDTLKKYGSRVKAGVQKIRQLESSMEDRSQIVGDPADTFALRPMGLMANGFLASENTGTTNELFLARWYINEMDLRLKEVQAAENQDEAIKSYRVLKKAVNSYLSMMNRVITPKVGDKFEYI